MKSRVRRTPEVAFGSGSVFSAEDVIALIGPHVGARILDVRQVHRCVHILTTDSSRMALKLRLPRRGIQRLAARRSFVEEVRINRRLVGIEFEAFRHPTLLETDGRNWLLFQNVDWVDRETYPPRDCPSMMSALLEFQHKLYQAQGPALGDRVRSLLSSPICSILREAFVQVRPLGLRALIKTIALALVGSWRRPPAEAPLYQHRDLGNPGNLKFDARGRFYFLDFESTRFLGRWPLLDAVDLSFDTRSLEFNGSAFRCYLAALKPLYALDKRTCCAQVRLLMLRKSLNLLRYDEHARAHREFLHGTLLDGRRFDIWFDREIGYQGLGEA